MNASIVLTVICDDRPGIVEMLSKTLAEHEGNWVESSMLSLAGKFAGILQASVPESQVDALLAQFSAMQSSGLQIIAERSSVEATEQDAAEVTLELVGQDRPGIVRDITRILAKHGVNVVELDTECQSASMSGEMLFLASARLIIPAEASIELLQEDLEKLANELMVDITLE
jgi:glycine cleavage system regulatory protein